MDRRTNRTDYTASERYLSVPPDTAEQLDEGFVMLDNNVAFYPDHDTVRHDGRVTNAAGEAVLFLNSNAAQPEVKRGTLHIVAPSFVTRAIARACNRNPHAMAFLTTDGPQIRD